MYIDLSALIGYRLEVILSPPTEGRSHREWEQPTSQSLSGRRSVKEMLQILWCLWLRKTPGMFQKHLNVMLCFYLGLIPSVCFTEPWGNTSLRQKWGGRPENHTFQSESNFPCHPGHFPYPSYLPAPVSQLCWRTERCSSRPHPLPEHVKPTSHQLFFIPHLLLSPQNHTCTTALTGKWRTAYSYTSIHQNS